MTEVLDTADNISTAESEEKASEQVQIRIDKLAALQTAGMDPFAETTYDVTKIGRASCRERV